MNGMCEYCGAPITKRHRDRPGRFCSRACYNDAGRSQIKASVAWRMTRDPDHPVAPPSGIVAVARVVLYDKIGPGKHPCHWCGAEVEWMPGEGPRPGALVVDHLNWDPRDDAPGNLVPSCRKCNAHRTENGRRRTIAEDEPTVLMNGKPTRAVERTCEWCSAAFLAVPAQVASGRGRFCSRSCAARGRWADRRAKPAG